MRGKDQIHTRVELFVSWPDRLRILLTGRAVVVVVTDTEHEVGWAHAESTLTAGRLLPYRPRNLGFGEAARPDGGADGPA